MTSKFYLLRNKSRHHKADEYYYLARNDRERDFLFTREQMEDALNRAKRNREDIPKVITINTEQVVEERGELIDESGRLSAALLLSEGKFRRMRTACIFSVCLAAVAGLAIGFYFGAGV